MANNQVDIVIRAVDQATRELDAVQRELKALEGDAKGAAGGFDVLRRSYDRALGPSRAVATAVATAGTAALGAAGYMIKLAGDMEQTEIAFTTLLGSTEAAEDYLRRLSDFAGRTPFDLPGLQNTTRRLVAFGFEADATIPIVRVLGDAVSAMGGSDEELLGVVNAIGQIQAKGKVSAEELLQLTERGIPAYEILREKLGLTSDEVANIGTMGISSTEAIMALLEGLDDRFAGAMEAQAQTLNGILSNIRDEATRTAVEVGQSIIDALNLKDALRVALDQLSAFRERVEEVGITGVLKAMEDQIWAVAGALTGAMIPAMINMAITVSRAALRLAPWIAAGILAFKVVQDLEIGLDDVLPYIKRFALGFQGAADIVMAITGAVASFISNSIRSIVRLGNFYAQSFEVMGRARDEFLAGNWRAGYEILQSNQANADTMVADFVDTWRGATEQLEASDALLFEGFEKIERAVAGSAESVDDALGTTGVRIEDVAASVAETGGSIGDLLALLGGEAGLTGGLLGVAEEGDAAADAIGRAADATDRLGKKIAEHREGLRLGGLLQGGSTAGDAGDARTGTGRGDAVMGQQEREDALAARQARAAAEREERRATEELVAGIRTKIELLGREARMHQGAEQQAAAAVRLAEREAIALEARHRAGERVERQMRFETGAANEQADALEDHLVRQAAAMEGSERAASRWEAAQTGATRQTDELANHLVMTFGQSLEDTMRASREAAGAEGELAFARQESERAIDALMAAEELAFRRRAAAAELAQRQGGSVPGASTTGEPGPGTEGSVTLASLDRLARALEEFTEKVAESAYRLLPTLTKEIEGLIGPMRGMIEAFKDGADGFAYGFGKVEGALGGFFNLAMALVQQSEAFEEFLGILNEIIGHAAKVLEPFVSALTSLLDAIYPIIDVFISLLEAGLKPVAWLLKNVVAPVFEAVAAVIAAVWNTIASILNIIPGVNLPLVDAHGSAPRPATDTGDEDPAADGGSGSRGSGRTYRETNFGGTPQSVQLAVATPIVEAATMMLQAAQMQLDQASCSPLATPVKAFGGHVDRFGMYVDRLLSEPTMIDINMRDGRGAGSRTAHLRGL